MADESCETARTSAFLVLLAPDSWTIFMPGARESTTKHEFPLDRLADEAPAVVAALKETGWRGEPLAVGLSASLCLSATVDVPAPQILRKRQAMRYHLEAWIPWSAEDYVADYMGHRTEAFMVAVRIEPLRGFLASLEEHDARPQLLIPTAVLAATQHAATSGDPDDHALLWRHGDELELFMFSDGKIWEWRHAEESVDAGVFAAATMLTTHGDLPWYIAGVSEGDLTSLAASGVNATSLVNLNWNEAVAAAIETWTDGDLDPPINLMRDELAPKKPIHALKPQLARLKIAAAIFVMGLCAFWLIRASQYNALDVNIREQLAAVYAETFPKSPVPDDVLRALRQERTRLRSTRGGATDSTTAPSGEAVLGEVLAALPREIRFRVPEIRLDGESVYLASEVRANSDADAIATALRTAGFDVDAPRTQRLAGEGFAARIAAKRTMKEGLTK